MKHLYSFCPAVCVGLLLLGWLLPGVGRAQSWSLATVTTQPTPGSGSAYVTATATDASGNVFATGYFTGQMLFGSTLLTGSNGTPDIFVAKWIPATNTWAWAMRAGGSQNDQGTGIAVSGNRVYITGRLVNNTANVSGVTFQQTSTGPGTRMVLGASSLNNNDVLVAKYVDNGSSATLGWVQVAGGIGNDIGSGIAASGTALYVTGTLHNSTSNDYAVVFGGNGTLPGTVVQAGATATASLDLFVARYNDDGNEASLAWTQVGGGMGDDYGNAVALAGNRVYVTGYLFNDLSNGQAVLFGGSGTTAGTVVQYGADASVSRTMVTAKYTDNGSSATLGWTQVGGTGGNAIAVRGSSVYVAGYMGDSKAGVASVLFGGTGATVGTVLQYGASATSGNDWMLVKYQDNGSTAAVVWTQVAGGRGNDAALGLVLNGTEVYLTGRMDNNAANANAVVFGGAGTVAGTAGQPGASTATSSDVVVARYTDNGASATVNWTQVGGGTGPDYGTSLAVGNNALYLGAWVTLPATFGSYSYGSSYAIVGLLGAFSLNGTLAATVPTAGSALTLYPNPASSAALLAGAAPTTAGQVTDALGRAVATFRTDAAGAAVLPAGLAPGVYAVRVGAATGRLVVQ